MGIDECLRDTKSAVLSSRFDCDRSMIIDGQGETWAVGARIIAQNAVPAWDIQIADAGLFRPDECVVIAIGDLGPADDPTLMLVSLGTTPSPPSVPRSVIE